MRRDIGIIVDTTPVCGALVSLLVLEWEWEWEWALVLGKPKGEGSLQQLLS